MMSAHQTGQSIELLNPAGPILSLPSQHRSVTVPPELWLAIFPFLDDKDLRAVTRTCSAFRLLAQPLLFHTLDVSPFFLAHNADRTIFRPRRYLQSTLDRLEFYKLPRIAPAVTELWISPYARNGFPPRRLTDDLNPNLVISAIIDALPAFPNLRVLTWHCLDIQPAWWAVIQRKSSLTRLWLNSCAILPSPSLDITALNTSQLQVAHLDLDQWAWEGQITNHVSVHEERMKGVDPGLLSMSLDPESIGSITVPRQDTALHLLFLLSHIGHDIQCTLTSLTMPYTSTTSEHFIPALVAVTALRELHLLPPQEEISGHPDLKENLPHSSIPLLEAYEGPYHLLPALSNAQAQKPRHLRILELWGLDEPVAMTVCDPHRLEAVLEEICLSEETLTCVQSLKILVTHVTIELMGVLSRFTHLQEIFLESQDSMIPNRAPPVHLTLEIWPESPISVLYVLLGLHKFSDSLKHFSLVTHLKNTNHVDMPNQYIDAAKFMEGLASANPSLEAIDVRYGTYWTGVVDVVWQRRAPPPQQSPSDDEATLAPFDPSNAPEHPAISRSSTDSSISSSTTDSSQAAVEKFFALPSRPKSAKAIIHLRHGNMIFTEQRRAVVLPGRMPPPRPKVNTPQLGWIADGVDRVWRLVGTVGRILGEGVGIARN